MSVNEGRAKLESIGRQCVKEIIRDGEAKAVIVLIGSVPKRGFPRGQYLGDHTDGKPIRMYSAVKLLAAVQQYMKQLETV